MLFAQRDHRMSLALRRATGESDPQGITAHGDPRKLTTANAIIVSPV